MANNRKHRNEVKWSNFGVVKRRRPNWFRIGVTLAVLIAVIISICCAISNAVKDSAKNSNNKKFIEQQVTEDLLDFTATANGNSLEEIPTPTGDCVWGIDISHWQEGIVTEKWIVDAKAAGCSFVYIQFAKTAAEYNVDNPVLDYTTLAIEFADAAEANGLTFGFYFLTDAKYETSRLSEFGFILHFVNAIKSKNYQYNRLPLMLDHEVYGDKESKEDSSKRITMLEKQVTDLKAFNIETIIYTSASKYPELVAALGEEQDFWLADYSYSMEKPGIAPTSFPEEYSNQVSIWQYSADKLSIQERGLSVMADYNSVEQQGLDRNLMKTEYFKECVNN